MQTQNTAISVLLRLCQGLCEDTNAVEIETTLDGDMLQELRVRCAPNDVRRLVGKGGKRIRSLKTIVAHFNHPAHIKRMTLLGVAEPEGEASTFKPFPPFRSNTNWPRESITALVRDVADVCFIYPAEVTMKERKDRAVYTIACSDAEPYTRAKEIVEALCDVIGAIGVTNGKHISIDVKLTA